jgi:DNA-binding PadR family transcriptional regulator
MNDLILLALLLDGPRHGYELKRKAGLMLGHGDMHNNLVYPLLRRFAGDGLVIKRAVPGERGQVRQQYALTPSGRKELLRRLSDFGEADASSLEGFMTRVGMFEMLDREVQMHILETREKHLRRREERLKSLGNRMETGRYGDEAIRHLLGQIRSELMWIRHLRRLSARKTLN